MQNRIFLIHGWEGSPHNHWFPWLKMELIARGFEVNAPQLPNAANPKVREWMDFLSGYVGKPDEDIYFVGHSLGCIAIARYLAGIHGSNAGGEHGTDSEHTPPQSSPLKSGGGKKKKKETAKIGGCVFVAGFSGFVSEQGERVQNLNPAPTPGRVRVRIAPPASGEARARMSSGAGVAQPHYTIPEIREFYELPFNPEKAKAHCDKFVMIFSDNDPYVSVAKSLEFAKQLGAKTILECGKKHFGDGLTSLPSALSAILKFSSLNAKR